MRKRFYARRGFIYFMLLFLVLGLFFMLVVSLVRGFAGFMSGYTDGKEITNKATLRGVGYARIMRYQS